MYTQLVYADELAGQCRTKKACLQLCRIEGCSSLPFYTASSFRLNPGTCLVCPAVWLWRTGVVTIAAQLRLCRLCIATQEDDFLQLHYAHLNRPRQLILVSAAMLCSNVPDSVVQLQMTQSLLEQNLDILQQQQ